MNQRRRSKLEKLCPDAMEHYDRIASGEPQPAHVKDMIRGSGTCSCFICDKPIFDHPQHPFDNWITIDCEGQFWKL